MKYIAFYFPQFHSIEENNQWWGHQFTDWELVQAAQQYTEEQRQPRIPLNNNYYDLTDAEVIAWQTQLAKKYGLAGFNFYHYTVDLTGGPCIYKRVSGCGVGTEYLAVTPAGDLYPCHQFVGDDDFKVGNVYDGIINGDVIDGFRNNNNVYTRDKCRGCFAKLYCSGGCAANNYHANGDINKVYDFGCELHKKRIECALMLKVAEEELGIERLPGASAVISY